MNFNEIIKANKQNVKNIIRLITKQDNEDLEQEVYLKIWKNADKYQERGTMKSWINTVAKNVSKAKGIQILATKYNITEENIIVFGDAENDLEMLETFKNSFLMKNGNKELVKYATYVTKKDNNHNGIYHSLRQILKFIK